VAQIDISQLPYIDEHAVVLGVGADRAWDALLETLEQGLSQRGAAAYSRAVGCADCEASGPRPLAAGSTLPGFRVLVAKLHSELVLVGRHRFSSYALSFRIEEAGDGSVRLHAESRAAFPGLTGRLYRLLVIDTGGHVLAVRRLLSNVRARAERR
jgi:hypothetical protein